MKNAIIDFLKDGKRVGLGLIFLSIYLLVFFSVRRYNITSETLEDFISPYGIYSLFIIYLLQIGFSLSPIPDGTLAIFSVLIIGPYKSFFIILAGMFTASMIHYQIALSLNKEYLLDKFPKLHSLIAKFNKNSSIEKLVLYRFFALVSFDIVAYLSGIARVPRLKYAISAILGFIPIILSSIIIASGVFAQSNLEVVLSWLSAAGIAFFIAYLVKRLNIENF